MLARPEELTEREDERTHMLEGRFSTLVEACSRFSADLARDLGNGRSPSAPSHRLALDFEIGRAVFGKWSFDILMLLHLHQEARFQEIRRDLQGITPRVLSSKLGQLQAYGLVRRTVRPTHPPRVAYSLTARGSTVAELGSPVFLYLHLTGTDPWANER